MAQIDVVSPSFSPRGSHRPDKRAKSPVWAAVNTASMTLAGSLKSTSGSGRGVAVAGAGVFVGGGGVLVGGADVAVAGDGVSVGGGGVSGGGLPEQAEASSIKSKADIIHTTTILRFMVFSPGGNWGLGASLVSRDYFRIRRHARFEDMAGISQADLDCKHQVHPLLGHLHVLRREFGLVGDVGHDALEWLIN